LDDFLGLRPRLVWVAPLALSWFQAVRPACFTLIWSARLTLLLVDFGGLASDWYGFALALLLRISPAFFEQFEESVRQRPYER
jgi:hypothetical protein